MVRTQLAQLCAVLLLWSSMAFAHATPQVGANSLQNLKEHLTQIPGGSIVEVKLAHKQKLRGRLGAVSDSGFDLQFTKAGKIVTETLAFDNVQTVKAIGQGWSVGKKILVGTLIGAGVLFLIIIIGCAAGGCSS